MTETLAGSHLIHDVGYLASGMTNSLESIVLADKVINWIRRFMQGVSVNAEALALDVIDECGPKGDSLSDPHTRAHFREDWYPKLNERQRWENWSAAGSRTFRHRAKDKVLELLGTHQPEPLPEDVAKAVQGVIDRAAEKYFGQHLDKWAHLIRLPSVLMGGKTWNRSTSLTALDTMSEQ